MILTSETGNQNVESLVVGVLTVLEKQAFDVTLHTGLGVGVNKESPANAPVDLMVAGQADPRKDADTPLDLSGIKPAEIPTMIIPNMAMDLRVSVQVLIIKSAVPEHKDDTEKMNIPDSQALHVPTDLSSLKPLCIDPGSASEKVPIPTTSTQPEPQHTDMEPTVQHNDEITDKTKTLADDDKYDVAVSEPKKDTHVCDKSVKIVLKKLTMDTTDQQIVVTQALLNPMPTSKYC